MVQTILVEKLKLIFRRWATRGSLFAENVLHNKSDIYDEAAITGGLTRDLCGAAKSRRQFLGVTLIYKPFIRWIWIGGYMALGGLLCMFDPTLSV